MGVAWLDLTSTLRSVPVGALAVGLLPLDRYLRSEWNLCVGSQVGALGHFDLEVWEKVLTRWYFTHVD